MGCCASTGDNYRKAWYTIRPQVPVGEANRGKRAELFAKLDKDKSGAVGPNGLEEVSSTFHLNEVCDRPVELLTEVYTATVGTGKLMSANMESFVERLRDAFDFFTMVNPERNEASKPVTTDDVAALKVQFSIMNYEWPQSANDTWPKEIGSEKDIPFVRFLRWALRERLSLMKHAGPATAPHYPVQPAGAESKVRDILYAQFDVEQANRMSMEEVSAQSVRYLAVDQYPGWDSVVRAAFEKVCKTDTNSTGPAAKYIDRQEFRKYLSALNDGITASMLSPAATTAVATKASMPLIDWMGLRKHFPYERSAEQLKVRDTMYASFDDNHTGKMSLSEARAGCAKAFGKEIPGVVTDDAVKTAFFAAAGADDNSGDENFVERNEFRVFLADLSDYCQLRAFLDSINAPGNPKTSQIPAMDPFWVYHHENEGECASEVRKLADLPNNEIAFDTLATWWIKRRRAKDTARPSADTNAPQTTERAMNLNAAPSVDWMGLNTHIPYQRSAEQLKVRDTMYASFDDNHTGKMSLSEARAGCAKEFKDISNVVTDDAVKTAFYAAAGADGNSGDAQFVERNEFRVFLADLHDYCQLRSFLDSIPAPGDPTTSQVPAMDPFWAYNHDDQNECAAEARGLAVGNTIPFDALATWWIKRRRAKDMARRSTDASANAPQTTERAMNLNAAPSVDWVGLSTHFPYQRSAEQLKVRDTMYTSFDDNHTGKMSLSEARAGCAKEFKDISNVVTDDAVKTAFYAAAGADDASGDAHFVERNEFRVFLADLHDYCQLRAFLDSINAPGNPTTSQVPAMEPFWVYHSDDSDACAADVRKLAVGDDIPFDAIASWWIKRRRTKDMARRSSAA